MEENKTLYDLLSDHIKKQDEQNAKQNRFMFNQYRNNLSVMQKINSLERGVYGDEPNETPGLNDRLKTNELEVNKLKNKQTRALAWGGGFIVGFNALIFLIKEFFNRN